MSIYLHELRQNRKNYWIWALAVGAMIFLCMILYPEMKEQMDEVDEMFSSMGNFTAAFGMDKVSFRDAIGFFAVECGSVVGIGGVLYCALLGVGMLSKEENLHTAEFLLTHPVNRTKVVTQKFLAIVSLIFAFYLFNLGVTVVSFLCIGETIEFKDLFLIYGAHFILGLETAAVCFGISAFLKSAGAGIGIGVGTLFYFLNLYGNITDKGDWVKYITPFSYADAATIISEQSLDGKLVFIGCIYLIAGTLVAFFAYNRKDICG